MKTTVGAGRELPVTGVWLSRIVCGVTGVLLAFAVSCERAPSTIERSTTDRPQSFEKDAERIEELGAVPVTKGSLTFRSVLLPFRSVDVVARSSGVLASVRAATGDGVLPGTVLAEVECEAQAAVMREMSALLGKARRKSHLAGYLDSLGLSSSDDRELSRLEEVVAQGQYDVARVDSQRCLVVSPIAGRVVRAHAQAGQAVRSGDVLFQVDDSDTLRIVVMLPEELFGKVRMSQPLFCRPDRGRKGVFVARVVATSPAIDPVIGMFMVQALADNRISNMPSGMSIEVSLNELPARVKR